MVKHRSLAPPGSLTGVDEAWSRYAQVEIDGRSHRIHGLIAEPDEPAGTIVCVHGNPTWAYLWRGVLAECGRAHRVVAVDQLGMGYSDRVAPRRLEQRVADLGAMLEGLGVSGRITLVAHDWGGPIALGWAAQNRHRVEGLVLINTGVEMPPRGLPLLIRLANVSRARGLLCERTSLFLRGALALSRSLSRSERAAYREPYRSRHRRRAIAEFVADIPTTPAHPSHTALARIAAATGLLDVPTLIIWGGRDPVFTDTTLSDLRRRIPHAQVARYAGAGHLVPEDAPVGALVRRWLHTTPAVAPPDDAYIPLASALADRAIAAPDEPAIVDLATGTRATAGELYDIVGRLVNGLGARGAQRGDRVAILAPVGVPLIAAVYACWQLGLVPILADRGLGLRGIRRALRSSQPRFALTTRRTRAAAVSTRLAPHATILVLDDLVRCEPSAAPAQPRGEELAAILFTSGATGPAKGVRYSHRQLAALREAMQAAFAITSDDALVAAFAPFALFGPALGIPVAIPDMDVTAPSTLRADALGEACRSVSSTLVFAAPAALSSVAHSDIELPGVRMVLSAGAPVSPGALRAARRLFPRATMHTPYGLTEMLLVTTGREPRAPGLGVDVGEAVSGAEVRVLPLGFDPSNPPAPLLGGETGEIVVHAPWCSAGYDGLWQIESEARFRLDARVWHRTGDVGHLDDGLWIEGRVPHVIHTSRGPVTPVGIEEAVGAALGRRAAAVGVGPIGTQLVVVVLEAPGSEGVVDAATASSVRDVAPEVAAVCRRRHLPVDIRHNSKVDRTAIARWADELLRGGR